MDRYRNTVEFIKHTDGKTRRYETMYYPKFERKTTDVYIIAKRGQRLDLLAAEYYNDVELWWVIFRANPGLPGGTLQLPPGRRIRIPFPLSEFTAQELLDETQF